MQTWENYHAIVHALGGWGTEGGAHGVPVAKPALLFVDYLLACKANAQGRGTLIHHKSDGSGHHRAMQPQRGGNANVIHKRPKQHLQPSSQLRGYALPHHGADGLGIFHNNPPLGQLPYYYYRTWYRGLQQCMLYSSIRDRALWHQLCARVQQSNQELLSGSIIIMHMVMFQNMLTRTYYNTVTKVSTHIQNSNGLATHKLHENQICTGM